jgi:TatD DNase family protein
MNQQSQNPKSQPPRPSLIDTHCHIHEADYPLNAEEVLKRAHTAGIDKLICVGTGEQSSADALKFAIQHENIYATIGVHPHDTKDGYEKIVELAKQSPVAVGEIGLDYFYTHSPREVQIKALESQIQTALDNNLPIIFHVRDGSSVEQRANAFNDFWPIFDNFHGIRGELHSFTDTKANLEEGLKRGLYVGVNGISTFTKDAAQQEMFATIPLNRMLLETDAPFLTPVPKRGNINEPAFVEFVAEFHAKVRGISIQDLADATTANATELFAL